jgi:hypothetical protein
MSDPKPNRNKDSKLPKDAPTRNVVYCIKISNRDLAAMREVAAAQGMNPSRFTREAILDRVHNHYAKERAATKTEPKSDLGSPPA